jgi:hypothetical protein
MSLQERRDRALTETTGTDESVALLAAIEAAFAGHFRIIATCQPTDGRLTRIVIDVQGDVLFASDALPTEDIVELRLVARRVPHGSRHCVGSYEVFVEHLP